MALVAVLAVSLLAILFFIFWRNSKVKESRRRQIPRVAGLPLIGNAHQIGPHPSRQFCKWSDEFGKIYQINLAGQRIIIISDAKLGKDVFSHPASTGKPIFEGITLHEDQHKPILGIAFSEGQIWENIRRLFVRYLRTIGADKSSMEQLITRELNEVLDTLKEKDGQTIGELDSVLKLPVVNALWTILTSRRFDHNNLEFINLAREGMSALNEIMTKGVLLFMPALRKVFPTWTGYSKIRSVQDRLIKYYGNLIQEHKENLGTSDFRDFMDVYMSEEEKGGPNLKGNRLFADRQLEATLNDTFFAGSDSTVNSLCWGMLYLSKFPDVQCKLQLEIEDVTNGNTRKPCLEDRKVMTYAQAVIDEILRLSSVVSDGAAHRVIEDFDMEGYRFPKDSWIQLNLYHIHHNPRIWGDNVNDFFPERFLSRNDNGSLTYNKNSNLLAFQVGRRVCVGEALARDTLFLYITSIIQAFNVRFGSDMITEPSIFDDIPGLTRSPKPFSVVYKYRL